MTDENRPPISITTVPVIHRCDHIVYKKKPVTKGRQEALQKEDCIKCKLKDILEEMEGL